MNSAANDFIARERRFGTYNYEPIGVVLSRGQGVWVWDTQGKRYLDCLSAYSAVNQGHCHPKILAAMVEQASKLTLTSRAFHNDQLAPFYEELAELTGSHKVLPMNSGAEAVESAIKSAPTIFTAAPWGSSASAPTRRHAIISDRSRRAFGSSPSATPGRWRRRSRRTPSPSSSSRSRAKRASSFRHRGISQKCAKSAPRMT